ncbi:MAG: hypothetical protein WBH47_24730, partial [Streptosporangiaceae bacterium]
ADRARRGARRRRQRALAAAAAACVALLVAAGLTYVVANHRPGPAATHRSSTARFRMPYGYQVSAVAVGGPYLYVLFDQADVLAAYDRATGKLVRRVTLPDSPSGLTVGPGGLVWVPYDAADDGAPYGLWLLSPDLRLHTAMANVTLGAIVPVSRTTAWSPSQYGLYWLSLPAPGSAGQGTWRLQPNTSIGPPLNTAPGGAVLVGGNVVAEVTNGYGLHGHLVIAGQPSMTYGGGAQTSVWGVTAVGSSLWAIVGSDANNFGGGLVRLDSRLRATTPATVRRSQVLSQVAAVWSHGDTVWVALGPESWEGGHSLACFRAGPRIGRVVSLPVTGQVVALAAANGSVYVSASPAGQAAGQGIGISSYRVPAACR